MAEFFFMIHRKIESAETNGDVEMATFQNSIQNSEKNLKEAIGEVNIKRLFLFHSSKI